MSYTREQLKEARQAKSKLEKKIESKLELAIAGTIITLIPIPIREQTDEQ